MIPPPLPKRVLITTTDTIEGKKISKYLGPLCGFSAQNLGLKGAFRLSIERAELDNYAELISQVQEAAVADLEKKAESINADAVVGIVFDFEFQESMCAGSVSGTAVLLDTNNMNTE